jgi:glycosyltransferase involved in cell wall biosynthesis
VVYWGLDRQFQPVADRTQALAVLGTYNVAPPYLLYVGGIEHRKNLTGLLKAFSKVKKALPGYKLVIVGKKNWRYKRVFSLISKLGLDADVVFTGYVPDSHLPCFYSLAEVFVFPSLYEGFGFPPLEAMACGTPVITSNTSSLPEVCGDAPLYVNPLDTDSLASAIQSAVLDRDQREAIVARGLAHVTRFLWERTAQETMEVYKAVLVSQDKGRYRKPDG